MRLNEQNEALFSPVGDLPDLGFADRHNVGVTSPQGIYGTIGKRCLDVVLVLLSMPVVLPVVALCAIALLLEGGNPFFRQKRLGQGKKQFPMLKLRTMERDAEARLQHYLEQDPALKAEWDTTQKLKNDPRITRVGRILRATSLDELPQLWNVLMGDMSLVGPRPMMVDQLKYYPAARSYFALRPGLTGPWQVGDRNQSSFAARGEYDTNYLKQLSFGLDLQILIKTVSVVVQGTGY